MAWRNVWRNTRRSVVTIVAMAFALWVMVVYVGLGTGIVRGMEASVLDLEVGDVQALAPGWLEKPSVWTAIPDDTALLAGLDAAGFPATSRLLGGGLVASGESSAGASLRGVDPEREARVGRLPAVVERGQWLDPGDPHGVIIGRKLAVALDVDVGGEVLVLGQATDGSMANELFTVRGVLGAVSDGTDRAAVFMTQAAFRELLVFPTGAHQVVVRRGDVPLGAAADRVRALAPGMDVRTWRDLMPTVAMMLDSTRQVVNVISIVMYLAVGILVLNAMLMAVFERIREFGVLKAVGVGPMQVLSLILLESAIQVGLAIGVGCGAAVPFMVYLSTYGLNVGRLGGADIMGVALDPHWYGIYDAAGVATPVVTLLVIVGLAVLYPAAKAARIQPVDAMHHQ
jgi:ABC-type lipoprotein release transport system permease subunit